MAITNDTFASLVGHRHIVPDATRALLGGVRSAQSEPAGWNAIVVPALQETCGHADCVPTARGAQPPSRSAAFSASARICAASVGERHGSTCTIVLGVGSPSVLELS